MTFTDLVDRVSSRTGMSKKDVKKVLQETIDTVKQEVLDYRVEVTFPHFGKFKRRVVKGGERVIGGTKHRVLGRDTLAFKSYAAKPHPQ